MSERLWGFSLVLLGIVMTWDGWRLWQSERDDSMFDTLGPDRYIMMMGNLLILTGLIIGLKRPVAAGGAPDEGDDESYSVPVIFTIALAAYALIIPWLGYTGATFLFFLGTLYLAGRRRIVPTLITATIATTCFYMLFRYLANMPLPRGILGF